MIVTISQDNTGNSPAKITPALQTMRAKAKTGINIRDVWDFMHFNNFGHSFQRGTYDLFFSSFLYPSSIQVTTVLIFLFLIQSHLHTSYCNVH